MNEWHFERLTPAEKERVKRLFKAGHFLVLKDFYQLKNVFTGAFCGTCKASKVVKEWTQWAIEQGKL